MFKRKRKSKKNIATFIRIHVLVVTDVMTKAINNYIYNYLEMKNAIKWSQFTNATGNSYGFFSLVFNEYKQGKPIRVHFLQLEQAVLASPFWGKWKYFVTWGKSQFLNLNRSYFFAPTPIWRDRRYSKTKGNMQTPSTLTIVPVAPCPFQAQIKQNHY